MLAKFPIRIRRRRRPGLFRVEKQVLDCLKIYLAEDSIYYASS